MKGIYLMGNYPDRDTFMKSCQAVARAGYDFLEIGIPFNDPVADGPVIARAHYAAIEAGATLDTVAAALNDLADLSLNKYLMTYANIPYSVGFARFTDIMQATTRGIIIPDVPNRLHDWCYAQGMGLAIIPFATLETRSHDIDALATCRGDFIYFVGLRGITGSQADFSTAEIIDKTGQLRAAGGRPVIIGFGVKTPDDARAALRLGDGFVVGTEAVKRQHDPAALEAYLRSLNP